MLYDMEEKTNCEIGPGLKFFRITYFLYMPLQQDVLAKNHAN